MMHYVEYASSGAIARRIRRNPMRQGVPMRKDAVRRRWIPGRQTLTPLPAWSDPRPEPPVVDLPEQVDSDGVTYDPYYSRLDLLRNPRRADDPQAREEDA
jgi:hypothetical protein